MKKTLLEIVQDILNDMDSDEVNTVDDTAESLQVAYIVRSVCEAMWVNRDWPHTRRLATLEETVNINHPTLVKVEDDFKNLLLVNYNKQREGETRLRYERVNWKEPDEFLRAMNSRNSDESNVQSVVDDSGVTLLVYNDRHPTFFTSFDDQNLVFDAYDMGVEATLTPSKFQVMANVLPKFYLDDQYIPDLPDFAFPALIEEAKSTASIKIRQMADQKSEQRSQQQNRWLSRKIRRVNGGIQFANFGRNGRARYSALNQLDKNNTKPT